MFFDIVRNAIHQWSAPKAEEDPLGAPSDPSKDRKSAPPAAKAPEKVVNPYDPNARYRHLKTEQGDWKKNKKGEDPTPWASPPFTPEMELEKALYQYAEKDVTEVEKKARKTPPEHSLSDWTGAWREVSKLSSENALPLKDRLLILHPQWARVEMAFEHARPDREGYREASQVTASAAFEDMKDVGRGLIRHGEITQLPKFSSKLAWYERRLEDTSATGKKLSLLREVIRESESNQMPDSDAAKQALKAERESYQAQVIRVSSKDKNKGRAQDLARAQYTRLQKDLQETAFFIERELAATLPRSQVAQAMQQVREGTYRVGIFTRARDWFSSGLGGLAGHQNPHGLHELVKKHRDMSETMRKIEKDLGLKG